MHLVSYNIPRPIAQCTVCGKTTHSENRIKTTCYQQYNEKHCKGIFEKISNENEWVLCLACSGTGFVHGIRTCSTCNENGWVHIKK